MATYVAEPDTFAGWSSTGRWFGCAGLVAGAVALFGWGAMHGRFRGWQPVAASDQLFMVAMEWVGGGVFVLMAVCVFGSILLSSRSRGTVTIDDLGVDRRIGNWSRRLRWNEIEGFVAMPYGGVTLIPREGSGTIEIPRFLDDYRGCIAELTARHLMRLPADRLREKLSWWERIGQMASTYFLLLSFEAKLSHQVRTEAFLASVAILAWLLARELRRANPPWMQWGYLAAVAVVLGYAARHVAHTW